MASGLTPTVITDKNGRVTTVHRRSSQGGKGARAIPPLKRDFAAEAREAVESMDLEIGDVDDAHGLFAFLAENAPLLYPRVIERCSVESMERDVWMNVARRLAITYKPDQKEYVIRYCNVLLNLYSVAVKLCEINGVRAVPARIRVEIENTLYSTQFYSHGDWDCIGRAMIANKYVVEEDRTNVIFGTYGSLERIVDLLPELAKRGSVDGETLEMLLESETPAMREGEL